LVDSARREFKEETGFDANRTGFEQDLGTFPQPSGKRLRIWAIEGDCNPADLTSNLFEMEWPPKSGRTDNSPRSIAALGLIEHTRCPRSSKGNSPSSRSSMPNSAAGDGKTADSPVMQSVAKRSDPALG
jgi:predicted NUDIX family NTP pyrophosphohydrolase